MVAFLVDGIRGHRVFRWLQTTYSRISAGLSSVEGAGDASIVPVRSDALTRSGPLAADTPYRREDLLASPSSVRDVPARTGRRRDGFEGGRTGSIRPVGGKRVVRS